MANEIERKYLVKNFVPELIKNRSYKKIEQFYIAYNQDHNVCTRVRSIKHSGDRADEYILCTKAPSDNPLIRLEFEQEITQKEYEALKTMHLGSIIKKTRYFMQLHFELDIFEIPTKLALVEMEFRTLDEAIHFETIDKPAWIGDEVTNNPQYYNSAIAGVSK